MNGLSKIGVLLKHELLQAWRSPAEFLQTFGFFLIVIVFFPFAVSNDPALLGKSAAGIIWVTAILSSMLALPRLYERDHQDGTLDQYLIQPFAMEWVVIAKLLAHWLLLAVPLLLLVPLAAQMLYLPSGQLMPLLIALALGMGNITLIGSLCGALVAGNRRGGIALAVIALPLYIPTLIFGSAASISGNGSNSAEMQLLLAMLLFLLPVSGVITALLLKWLR